jgi:hypothetical protein
MEQIAYKHPAVQDEQISLWKWIVQCHTEKLGVLTYMVNKAF